MQGSRTEKFSRESRQACACSAQCPRPQLVQNPGGRGRPDEDPDFRNPHRSSRLAAARHPKPAHRKPHCTPPMPGIATSITRRPPHAAAHGFTPGEDAAEQ
ncbi:hypothetical protein K466DRAFT_579563 [Polyporus arcularius HHB13444]|uniref:Uncharacterized protein n=1 Tax=Polyporus arcularius HHB13444 TaxID=1314778 RepID=A0A5C3Q3A2_9APHY|nr:hypothetical protein K466DRAFT_579563 [Polyporus arcularius HHB13444]